MSMPSSRAFVAATPEQSAVAQLLLEHAAVLGQVAAAVRRHPAAQPRLDLVEQSACGEGHRLGPSS